MAALAASAVNTLESWREGDVTGKYHHVVKRVTLTLTAQGTVANPINAATLGFARLLEVTSAVDAANTNIFIPAVSANGLLLLLRAAATAAPADVTGVITLNVKGIA